jgi:hypothetical protein
MKKLFQAVMVSSLIASCGVQESNVNSVNPILSDEQSVTDIKMSCIAFGNTRELTIDANATFVDSRDSLHIISKENGNKTEKEFSLNERSGALWSTLDLQEETSIIDLEIVAKGSNAGVIQALSLNVDDVCNNSDDMTQQHLDELASDINRNLDQHKPADDYCKIGIMVGPVCLEGKLPPKKVSN